jgi:hypothetical protein
MSSLLKEAGVTAVALALALGAVFGLGDRAVLVPPPEMAVEEFIKALSRKRWEPAREYLTAELAGQESRGALQDFAKGLEQRIGPIEDVKGEPFFATAHTAEAVADIRTADGGSARLRLPLALEHGLWRIRRLDLDGLTLE